MPISQLSPIRSALEKLVAGELTIDEIVEGLATCDSIQELLIEFADRVKFEVRLYREAEIPVDLGISDYVSAPIPNLSFVGDVPGIEVIQSSTDDDDDFDEERETLEIETVGQSTFRTPGLINERYELVRVVIHALIVGKGTSPPMQSDEEE